MSGSLAVAIIVVLGSVLAIGYALNSNDATTGADSSGTGGSTVTSVEAEAGRLGIVMGCTNSGGPASTCQCVADQIVAAGYDTTVELATLGARIQQASPGDVSALPPDAAAAISRCTG